jgi:hypothetical protein
LLLILYFLNYKFKTKIKQIKSEIERKEPEVKRIIDIGNDMLKNSAGGVSNVADLARSLININNKWGNLNRKVDMKNKIYNQFSDCVNELRRKIITFWLFFS